MKSRTTASKKHWHHTEDKECPLCKELTVFVVDHRDNEDDIYQCTECWSRFVEEAEILMSKGILNE